MPSPRRVRGVALTIVSAVVVGTCGSPPAPSRPPSASTAAGRSAAPVASRSPTAAGPTTSPATIAPDRLAGRLVWSAGEAGDVYTARIVDGAIRAPERLTSAPVAEYDADLSPDGRRIAFRVNPDPAADHADVWLMAIDGSAPRNLTVAPELDNWSPAWSPDGSRLAFASVRDGGTLSVWTMDPAGGDLRRITTGHGEYPDWSPDGASIVYAAPLPGGGRYDLWTVPLAGGATTRITSSSGTDFAPAWSPDGRWIAYQTEIADRWELWLVHLDGSDPHRASPAGEDGVWATWTPAGHLAWSGPHGVSVLDVSIGATATLRNPPAAGTAFLSWGVDAGGS